jgi:hypothetical protein
MWGIAVCCSLAMSIRLQFEGIRCFPEAQDAIIRPLTLLVGENSSGKSTFLALCQIASSLLNNSIDQKYPFNDPPFLLGAYDQIASYRGGRGGRAKSFFVTLSLGGDPAEGSIRADFMSRNGQPSLRAWQFKVKDLLWQLVPDDDRGERALLISSDRGKKEIRGINALIAWDFFRLPSSYLADHWDMHPASKDFADVFSPHDIQLLAKTFNSISRAFGSRTYAMAPIRTSPARTYDPVSAEPKPEGSHVPMLLASLSRSAPRGQWAALQHELADFGSKSGLFEQIEVVRKGQKESDPFQIGVRSGGPSFNLVDVGYGVSQALPILVDTLQRSSADEVFLLQQPEVHLHPRAQAELGSFFVRQAAKKRRFVIETHSDYLIDRVRMEVRRGTHLKAEDVSLLYFDRQKHGAAIHNIELAPDGRIHNPPSGYRQFFLDEERDLLDI